MSQHTISGYSSYLGIAAEVARSERVGRREGGGGGYGGQGAIGTSSSSGAALLSPSLALAGPATPEDPTPQGGGAARGAAWRVTGRTGERKTQTSGSGEIRGNTLIFHCDVLLRDNFNVML